ncbi:MAG: type II toxin-antitoxin system VapC family toxin [Candidatus Thiodiazotropha sp. (ex Lucinoma borealis)]|nr:type II toxin-antitoxin system VapC family toxin [Candidatus Thiodiazotropha sp. (ex Lucinoma borealis)]
METIRTHLLDTSALLKLFLIEDGSENLRGYFNSRSVFWTTSFCFAELLGVLKRKYLSNKENLTEEEYLATSEDIVAHFRNHRISIAEVDITQFDIFNDVENIVRRYSIDLADAFQVVTLKRGIASSLTEDSRTILITADSGLSEAAKNEGLRVWNCLNEPAP